MSDEQALERLRTLDYSKPVPAAGELLCNGCWKLSGTDKAGWTSYGFKNLANQTLCRECADKFGHDLQMKQKMGF